MNRIPVPLPSAPTNRLAPISPDLHAGAKSGVISSAAENEAASNCHFGRSTLRHYTGGRSRTPRTGDVAISIAKANAPDRVVDNDAPMLRYGELDGIVSVIRACDFAALRKLKSRNNGNVSDTPGADIIDECRCRYGGQAQHPLPRFPRTYN